MLYFKTKTYVFRQNDTSPACTYKSYFLYITHTKIQKLQCAIMQSYGPKTHNIDR